MEAVTPERPGRGGCPALQVSHKMVTMGIHLNLEL